VTDVEAEGRMVPGSPSRGASSTALLIKLSEQSDADLLAQSVSTHSEPSRSFKLHEPGQCAIFSNILDHPCRDYL
jgi:hypothetical protein